MKQRYKLLFSNFLETGELSKGKYDDIIKTFNLNDNLILNNPTTDYIDVFNMVDAMITDPTSLLPEFYYTGKPVIYCDKSSSFNEAGKIMQDGLYYASTWENVEEVIRKLFAGEDSLNKYRYDSLKQLNPYTENGKRICNYLLNDYFG